MAPLVRGDGATSLSLLQMYSDSEDDTATPAATPAPTQLPNGTPDPTLEPSTQSRGKRPLEPADCPRGALDPRHIHGLHEQALAEFKADHPNHCQRWEACAHRFAIKLLGRETLAFQLELDIFGAVLYWIKRNRAESLEKRASPVVDVVTCWELEETRKHAADVAKDYFYHARQDRLKVEERKLAGMRLPSIAMPERQPTLRQYAEMHGLDMTHGCMGISGRKQRVALFQRENKERVDGYEKVRASDPPSTTTLLTWPRL